MILADLGVAAVIVLATTVLVSLWCRSEYRRLHPPPTTEEEIARLEKELGMKEDPMKAEMVVWDWKEQPDLKAIATAVREISGGKVFMEEYDTGGDMYALVISDRAVSEEEAQKLFRS